jgi:hypothetical protein
MTPTTFQLIVVKNAMKLYINSNGKLKANRAYTLTGMLKTAATLLKRERPYPRSMEGLKIAHTDLQRKFEEMCDESAY